MKLTTLKPRLQSVGSRLPAVQAASDSWRAGKSSTQRGYGYNWQQARQQFLKLNPFCLRCIEAAGLADTPADQIIVRMAESGLPLPWATVVDHKIPHRGDQALFWNRANWQSLCATHHSRDKQREEARRGYE